MTVRARLQPGDTLVICSRDRADKTLHIVEQRKSNGWLLKSFDGADPKTWTDLELLTAHIEQRLQHFSCNLANIPAKFATMLEKAWDYWPRDLRRRAERRLEFVLEAERIRCDHATLQDVYEHAATVVWDKNHAAWAEEDRYERAARQAAGARKKRRNARDARQEEDYASKLVVSGVDEGRPSTASVRRWFLNYTQNGRKKTLLIPMEHLRGNRTPRRARSVDPQKHDCYSLMHICVAEGWMSLPRRTKRQVFGFYKQRCEDEGIVPLSEHALRAYIHKQYSDREEHAKRWGSRSAYVKYGVFDRRSLPERLLEEVEVDHCLIDIVVRHPVTGKPLGRPWLTAFIDRATRVILGMHLSFEPPSYTSLQRAMINAFLPKDVSGVAGLKGDWPCFGVPESLFCDNGKEFRCKSLAAAEKALQFQVVNLPVKQPWLKGAIERLFGTINVRVLTKEEGAILSRTKDVYDPVDRAVHTLADLGRMLVTWVVNEYHETPHPALGHIKPIERWRQLADEFGVRMVSDFDEIIQLTGQVIDRQIQNDGIHYKGLLFSDKAQLTNLRGRRGGLRKEWRIRLDPYDLGEIYLLDDEEGRWIPLRCTNSAISEGVSLARHRVHLVMAAKNNQKGTKLNEGHIFSAKLLAEARVAEIIAAASKMQTAARAARYECDGALLTPIASLGRTLLPVPPLASVAAQPSATALQVTDDEAHVTLIVPRADLSTLVDAKIDEWEPDPL